MSVNDLKFFTNAPERDLYGRFSTILKNQTQFFDVLVGYFRTSGFFRLYPAMTGVEKIRILVGLNVDKKTVDIIEQAEQLTLKEATEEFTKGIEGEFEQSETSAEIEKGVHQFIEWLKTGKLEMRMYVDAPIHAKVYIMRKDPNKADYYGSVITGSSNFSEAGLINNLEFNVELKDMGELAESTLLAGGRVTGVEPQFFIDAGFEYDDITELIVTKDMSDRKAKMIELGEAFIAFPGGTGTLEEISEVISKICLRHLQAPCIVYNLDGYYEGLKSLLVHMVEMGLASEDLLQNVTFAENLEEIKRALEGESHAA